VLVQKAHRWKRRVTSTAGWDAVRLRPAEIGRNVVVLSPHLDDAVFSLGATISGLSRCGARVTVLTAFGGDPSSRVAAGDWDQRTGFETAGEAAAARRGEDRRACALLGATPVWHPFVDVQYEDGTSDGDLLAVVGLVARDADTLLVPGFPLTHPDHARITPLVVANPDFAGKIALYAELPYALWSGPAVTPEPLREVVPAPPAWSGVEVSVRDVVLKMRACRTYESQVPCFPERVVWRMARHELVSNEVLASFTPV
jgi:LmbE family N-acetylglucosaminyl deacetylase